MILKLKLAVAAVEERDYIKDENRRAYGEGFLEGFNKAIELILTEFQECKDGDLYIEAPYSYFENLGEKELH